MRSHQRLNDPSLLDMFYILTLWGGGFDWVFSLCWWQIVRGTTFCVYYGLSLVDQCRTWSEESKEFLGLSCPPLFTLPLGVVAGLHSSSGKTWETWGRGLWGLQQPWLAPAANTHQHPLPSIFSSCSLDRQVFILWLSPCLKQQWEHRNAWGLRKGDTLRSCFSLSILRSGETCFVNTHLHTSCYLLHEVSQLANLEKKNLMAASCPVELLLIHTIPLCKSERGSPSVGQVQPCA